MEPSLQAAFRAQRLLSRGVNLAETPAALAEPGVVQIEPVGRRKLSVRMSPVAQRAGVKAGPPPAFMSFDGYCRLVEKLVPPLELYLQGEEDPLLHPRFFDMVAFATQRGLDVSTTTRLVGLTARRAEECVLSGLKRLHVVPGGEPGLVQRSLQRLEEAKRRLRQQRPEVLRVEAAPGVGAATRIGFSGLPLPS
jgi:hypothetical protein